MSKVETFCVFFSAGNDDLIKMSSMIRQKHLTEKILKYETFLNERLRPDLKAVLQERDEIFTETAEFVALRVQSFGVFFL